MMNSIYLIFVMILLSIWDIRDLKAKGRKKDIFVYTAVMLLVVAFAIFYYSHPERASFTKVIFALMGIRE